jgi:hypothetical protein
MFGICSDFKSPEWLGKNPGFFFQAIARSDNAGLLTILNKEAMCLWHW